MVVPGYWNKPEETEHALPGGALHTGDVGYMDADGWFYLVDRKKDQINAGGYKVWPREVEDILYQHEAVREAAVVGVPDAYRGETVKASPLGRRARTSVSTARVPAGSITSSISNAVAVLSALPRVYCSATSSS